MIHSSRPMPTGNLDDSSASSFVPRPTRRAFRWPAEYYTAPLSDVRPVLPRWVPIGCGSAAVLFLVLLFAGAAFVTTTGVGQFMDIVLGMSLSEVRAVYAPDVTAADKQRFEAEVEGMRAGLRNGAVPMSRVQPFLQKMQKAIGDRHVTRTELTDLAKAAHDAARQTPETRQKK